MFSTQSHAENLALLRAVIEAKFHSQPNDTDIPGSAILARAAIRLRDAVIAEEVSREGAKAAERWQEWVMLNPARPEWVMALQFAENAWGDFWNDWSEDEKVTAVSNLLSPYEIGLKDLEAFIVAIWSAFSNINST